jgi:predicted DNA-binding protein with PD1-like motif
MQHQLIRQGQGSRTWSILLDSGEEAHACLEDFARHEILSDTSFTASGSFEHVVLGDLGESNQQDEQRTTIDRPTQVLSLAGDIALESGGPQIRMRAVLGDNQGGTFDGYLLQGRVCERLQIIMTEAPVQLHKGYDADAGLALFKHLHEAG